MLLRLSTIFFLCLSGCLANTPEPAQADEPTTSGWTQWRGPNRDGKSAQTGINTSWESNPPKLIWKATGLGEGFAGVSVADGTIYTTGNLQDGQAVIALSEENGEILWKTPVTDRVPRHGYNGSRCTPTIDGDFLYVVSSDGAIICLKRENGEIAWSKDFGQEWEGKMMSGWGFSESPLVDGDKVICTPGGKQALMVALDKKTGETLWTTNANDLGGKGNDGAGYSSVVISNGAGVKQYVQLVGHGLVGVRAEDGELLWTYDKVANGTANIPTPITSGDFVFASSGYGTGAALLKLVKSGDSVEAEEVYFLPANTLQNHHGQMILHEGYIYCGHGHNNGFPICVEMSTGEVVWGGKIRGPGGKSASVIFVDGHLIFRYETGDVALIEATPEDYKLKGSFKPEVVKQPSWAMPVVANGRLYLREQDTLMAYDILGK